MHSSNGAADRQAQTAATPSIGSGHTAVKLVKDPFLGTDRQSGTAVRNSQPQSAGLRHRGHANLCISGRVTGGILQQIHQDLFHQESVHAYQRQIFRNVDVDAMVGQLRLAASQRRPDDLLQNVPLLVGCNAARVEP